MIGMSLKTPEKIGNPRKKLYLKAKQEPTELPLLLAAPVPAPYSSNDKVWRGDILEHACRLVKSNRGQPGVDGVTFQQIESQGREEWLRSLQEDLRSKAAGLSRRVA